MVEAARPALRAGIVLVALLLLWRALHVNVALYGDDGRPRVGSAPGLVQALDDNPAEVAALLMLAREHESRGDRERAARALRSALDLAPYGREALLLATDFFLRADDPAGVELLGRLADTRPDSAVFAALGTLLASERHRDAVSSLLDRRPAWLAGFVLEACRRGVDPARVAAWMPRATGHGVPAETACGIDRMRAAGRWNEAYQLWLNALPRERLAQVGYVFNGGFEYAPTGIGFDWVLQQRPEREAGHSADVMQTSGAAGRRALRIAYNGKRQAEPAVRQFLALAPGPYELSGLARIESIKAVRGVHWTMRCAVGSGPGRLIGASERFVGSGEWRRFSAALDVPAACPGQVLQLEFAGDEAAAAFVSGTAWFDDLTLRRR